MKKQKSDNTEFLAFHVDKELKEVLVAVAKENDRSLSNFMRYFLRKTFMKTNSE